MKTHRWTITAAIFAVLSVLWTVLAWNGDNVALVGLGITCLILAGFVGMTGSGWGNALAGWKRSTEAWGATQEWGFKQDEILRETINNLREYDEEAAVIQFGRRIDNNADYMALLSEEELSTN